jgi:hypothetical protein
MWASRTLRLKLCASRVISLGEALHQIEQSSVRSRPCHPPLCDTDERQCRDFHEALLDADTFEDLPSADINEGMVGTVDRG